MNGPRHQILNGVSSWTAQTVAMDGAILDRMERAVANVRERLLRATTALNRAGISYAVGGGHAVASWVATVDEGRSVRRATSKCSYVGMICLLFRPRSNMWNLSVTSC